MFFGSRSREWFLMPLVAVLLVVMPAGPASAQTESASGQLTIRVTDLLGSPVANAAVEMARADEQRTATTDREGTAVVDQLPAGEWTISILRPGFATWSGRADVQSGSERVEANIGLNLAHIHLLLNHTPTIGFGVGLGLFLVALFARSNELKRASYVMFFLIAVIAIPTYVSGNAAQDTLRDPDVSQALIEAHEGAALSAFMFMEVAGFIAWVGLWELRRIRHVSRWSQVLVLVFAILTFGYMARAANMGGEIRHSEIQAVPEAAAPEGPVGLARSIALFVTNHAWVWPASETLHFIGLSFIFTVVLMVDLRLLGMMKSVSFAQLYQLLPLGMLGFAVNLITGMLFFVAAPGQYTQNVVFYWKVLLIVLAGINVLYFMLSDGPWKVGSGEDAPMGAKIVAASAIFLWMGVLFCGHMLPFIGNAF